MTIYNKDPLTCCLVLDYCNLGKILFGLVFITNVLSGDLGSILGDSKKYSNLPKDFFIRIAEDIASGIKFLHSRKILHRDIKPANVLLRWETSLNLGESLHQYISWKELGWVEHQQIKAYSLKKKLLSKMAWGGMILIISYFLIWQC